MYPNHYEMERLIRLQQAELEIRLKRRAAARMAAPLPGDGPGATAAGTLGAAVGALAAAFDAAAGSGFRAGPATEEACHWRVLLQAGPLVLLVRRGAVL